MLLPAGRIFWKNKSKRNLGYSNLLFIMDEIFVKLKLKDWLKLFN